MTLFGDPVKRHIFQYQMHEIDVGWKEFSFILLKIQINPDQTISASVFAGISALFPRLSVEGLIIAQGCPLHRRLLDTGWLSADTPKGADK